MPWPGRRHGSRYPADQTKTRAGARVGTAGRWLAQGQPALNWFRNGVEATGPSTAAGKHPLSKKGYRSIGCARARGRWEGGG